MRSLPQAGHRVSTGTRSRLRVVLSGALAFGGLSTLAFGVTTALTEGTASASPAALFSSTTPGTYSLAVPTGVSSITVTAVGGTGGMGDGSNGGQGAIVTATVAVDPGEQLAVSVARNGGTGNGSAGGFGEGSGGSAGPVGSSAAGSGGGASAVYSGSSPLVVAGGGGGGGGAGDDGDGGAAGQPAPAIGATEELCSLYDAAGAATETGAGSAGYCDLTSGGGTVPASNGGSLAGGNGGEVGANGSANSSGGGGGGGLLGGGGGDIDGGGGGSSYPEADISGLDTTATPAVTIATTDFYVSTTSLTPVTPGKAYAPVPLQAANVGVSTSPFTTTLRWKKVSLPHGLKLSPAGVLWGVASRRLPGSPSSVKVEVTETVISLKGKVKVTTKTTVHATIPLSTVTTAYGGPAVFDAITCLNTTDCFVVGSTSSSTGSAGTTNTGLVAVSVDGGQTWEARQLPVAVPELNAVSCFGSTCLAVGETQAVYTDDWGVTWSVESVVPSFVTLDGASCFSESSCVVVGSVANPYGEAGAYIGLTSDGGGSWQNVTPTDPPHGALGSVSCVSSLCEAVGSGAVGSTDGGTTWENQTFNGGLLGGGLHSVSCGSSTTCIAAAYNNDPNMGTGATVFSFDQGASYWNPQTTPANSAGAEQVGCATSLWCVAVGPPDSATGLAYFMLTTDGGASWSNVAAPTGMTWLTDISCPISTYCVTIGQNAAGAAEGIGSPGATWSVQSDETS